MAKARNGGGRIGARGLLQLTRLPAATLAALQRQLRREQYHIFHFIGHGGFDQQTQDGVLLVEDEADAVAGSTAILWVRCSTITPRWPGRAQACKGPRTTRSDPFAGVAQQLVRQGIRAVIAMQFEISDKAAIIRSREFYRRAGRWLPGQSRAGRGSQVALYRGE